jgi:SAM-dependent methyltransferase
MMSREMWLETYGQLYETNGYSAPPWAIYDQFLGVVDRPGPVLELGCGNGLLLRFLCDLSGLPLQAFGVDIKESRIREAKTTVFPEREACFVQGDLRDGVHHAGHFATLLVNPLYADRGYYEQIDGKIPKLHLDGTIRALVLRCWQSVAPGGRLVLWCYDGHVVEIAAQLDEFRATLAATGLTFREIESGPVSFWLADRPGSGHAGLATQGKRHDRRDE